MTSTTIHLPATRLGFAERIATTVGIARVVWANTGYSDAVGYDEQSRRIAVSQGTRSREHAALRAYLCG